MSRFDVGLNLFSQAQVDVPLFLPHVPLDKFRQPFDMIVDMATVGAQKMAAGLLTSSHHQEELPRLDSNQRQTD